MTQPIQLNDHRMMHAALWYAARGLHVFPLYEPAGEGCSCRKGSECRNAGKHPRTPRGMLAATCDADRIREWWSRWPGANIGIATGPSGLVVVDVDPRSGGDENLSKLEREHGELPHTPTALTGGGGQHYVFRRPQSAKHLKSMSIRRGVDVKADGGYIVAAPSIHASGRPYVWDAGARIEETELAMLPEWIVRMVEVPEHQRAPSDGAVTDGFLGAAFREAGWLGRDLGGGKAAVRCPWEDEHTSGSRYDSSTVVFAPAAGKRTGHFHCSHSHCQGRTLSDVLSALPEDAKRRAREALGLDRNYDPSRPAEPAPDATWEHALRFNDRGQLTRDVGNVVVLLTNLEEWAGTIEYDEFADTCVWTRPVPRLPGMRSPQPGEQLADHHYVYVHHWFAKHRGVSFTKDSIRDALVSAARMRTRHPLRDYLQTIEWDGKRRIPTWLSVYLGAQDTEYTRAVGQYWLVSAVARVFRPGCQADHLLVLEGSQGRGKSSAVRILGGDWCLGSLPDIRTKDAAQALQGKWIVEIGELDAFKGAGATRVKDWITQTADHYRPAYGRFAVTRPRQCVFIGTTNEEQYLADHTGGRRFWPVACGEIDRDALIRDRDQLWAEAVQAYEGGMPWWPDESVSGDIEETQAARSVVDAWEERVLQWVTLRDEFTMGDVLEGAIGLTADRWDRSSQTRVGAILAKLRLRVRRVSRGTRRVRVYERMQENDDVRG